MLYGTSFETDCSRNPPQDEGLVTHFQISLLRGELGGDLRHVPALEAGAVEIDLGRLA